MILNSTLRIKILEKFHSQDAFGRLIDVDPGTISRFIHGKQAPTARQLDFMTTLLKLPKEQLFPEIYNKKKP